MRTGWAPISSNTSRAALGQGAVPRSDAPPSSLSALQDEKPLSALLCCSVEAPRSWQCPAPVQCWGCCLVDLGEKRAQLGNALVPWCSARLLCLLLLPSLAFALGSGQVPWPWQCFPCSQVSGGQALHPTHRVLSCSLPCF